MKHYFFNIKKRKQYLLIFGDFVVVSCAILLTYFINFAFFSRRPISFNLFIDRIFPLGGILAFLYIFVFYIFDLYTKNKIKNFFRSFLIICLGTILVSLSASSILFFFKKYIVGRRIVLINIPIAICLLGIWHYVFNKFILKKEIPSHLALIGDSENLTTFCKEFPNFKIKGHKITHACIIGPGIQKTIPLPQSVEAHESIEALIENADFDTLLYSHSQTKLSNNEIRQIIQLKHQGKSIFDFTSFYENQSGKIPVDIVDDVWFLSKADFQGISSRFYKRIKRLFDVLLAATMLILLIPFCVLIAIAIRADSKGKIFFRQERLGLWKRPFTCIKFRTMKMRAEELTGPVWSDKKDPRITRIGKILRATRLDELPQIWNILKGEMSFVGNRPIRKHFADQLENAIPYYNLRFSLKPGLTGWAQVNHDYAGSKEGQFEKFKYELFYIKNISLFLDLFIIFKTFRIAFQRKGV